MAVPATQDDTTSSTGPTKSNAQAPQASLLGIAVEVRCMIYEQSFPPTLEYFDDDDPRNKPLRFRRRVGRGRVAIAVRNIDTITRACKQLRREAIPVLSNKIKAVHLMRLGKIPVRTSLQLPQKTIWQFRYVQIVYIELRILPDSLGYDLPLLHTIVIGDGDPWVDDWIDLMASGVSIHDSSYWPEGRRRDASRILD